MSDLEGFCLVLSILAAIFLVFLLAAHCLTRGHSVKGWKPTRYQQIIMRENGEKTRRILGLKNYIK